MDLLQVLVNLVHESFVESNVDQTEKFNLLIGLTEGFVVIVYVLFELHIEVTFNDRLVVSLKGRGDDNYRYHFALDH